MILSIIILLIAILSFLYLYWKRLREDYTNNQIFSSAFYVLIATLIGKVAADNFLPELYFWFCATAGVVGFWMAISRYRMKFYETAEAAISGSLVLLVSYHLYRAITFKNVEEQIWLGVFFVILLFYIFLSKKYKKFTWYRSGKVGFSAFTVLGLFFLVRTIIALLVPRMVSLWSTYEAILSVVLTIVCFAVVFNLARKT